MFIKKKKKAFLWVEIFKCTLSKVEVLHNLYRHYMKIKRWGGGGGGEQITRASSSNHAKYRTQRIVPVTILNIGRGRRREHPMETSEGVT